LRCAVDLWKPSEGLVTSTWTEDISSGGFYCMTAEPYLPGIELQATLEVPFRYRQGRGADCLVLQCQVEVLRAAGDHLKKNYGLACQFKAYRIIAIRTCKDSSARTIASTPFT